MTLFCFFLGQVQPSCIENNQELLYSEFQVLNKYGDLAFYFPKDLTTNLNEFFILWGFKIKAGVDT